MGVDSNSTPAVANGFVYTASEDGLVRAYKEENGEPVWTYRAEGGLNLKTKEKSGFWASPIISRARVFIGSNNGYLYCLSATDGKLVWSHLARAAIWGTSPVVDGRVIFGDKSGWVYALSAKDGKLISEIQIGENVDATPAIMDGQIYVGAFDGNFYRLK
jgi:outer membrane protein assembly factor BamB